MAKKLERIDTPELHSSPLFPENYVSQSSGKAYNPDSSTSSHRGRIRMDWPRLLAYITGTVDQELLLRNEYLVAENRILKAQIQGPVYPKTLVAFDF
jgi:hypothetical protein